MKTPDIPPAEESTSQFPDNPSSPPNWDGWLVAAILLSGLMATVIVAVETGGGLIIFNAISFTPFVGLAAVARKRHLTRASRTIVILAAAWMTFIAYEFQCQDVFRAQAGIFAVMLAPFILVISVFIASGLASLADSIVRTRGRKQSAGSGGEFSPEQPPDK